MKKILLFLIISGISLVINAQELGYIKNDSAYIACDIYKQNEGKSAKSCIARLKNSSQDIVYSPDQILGYGYGKTDYYTFNIILGNDTIKRFLEAIVNGSSPVYYLAGENEIHIYILNKNKELVELVKDNDEYKQQLATYFEAPAEILPRIHFGFTRNGVIQTVKLMKGSSLEVVNDGSETIIPPKKALTIKQKRRMRIIRPLLSISLQTGLTVQKLPLDLQAGLPTSWDEFKGNSFTYSLAVDIPIIKYWPVTYHQEICFNKFVNDYRRGSNPPEDQLIQDFSVISLPAMVRYSFGEKNFKAFINAGLQIDIALNKNNVGWLKLRGDNTSGFDAATIAYRSYNKIQPGITAGFGIHYKLSKELSINSEFRSSSVFNILPDKSETEHQSTIKAGITYNIFKKEK